MSFIYWQSLQSGWELLGYAQPALLGDSPPGSFPGQPSLDEARRAPLPMGLSTVASPGSGGGG